MPGLHSSTLGIDSRGDAAVVSCLFNFQEVQRFNCLHEKTVILLKDPQKQAIMRQEIRGTTATIKRLEDNAEVRVGEGRGL